MKVDLYLHPTATSATLLVLLSLQSSRDKKIQWPLTIEIPPSPLCFTQHCGISLYQLLQSGGTKGPLTLADPF